MTVVSAAMLLIIANTIKSNSRYIETALEQLNYVFGKNPLGVSYVTGIGEHSVQNPCHVQSIVDGVEKPLPGLVVSGANANKDDPIAKNQLPKDTPAAKCYLDREDCYSLNEVSVYWNAMTVFVTAFFDDPKCKVYMQ